MECELVLEGNAKVGLLFVVKELAWMACAGAVLVSTVMGREPEEKSVFESMKKKTLLLGWRSNLRRKRSGGVRSGLRVEGGTS